VAVGGGGKGGGGENWEPAEERSTFRIHCGLQLPGFVPGAQHSKRTPLWPLARCRCGRRAGGLSHQTSRIGLSLLAQP
jgi:hypothetical protein